MPNWCYTTIQVKDKQENLVQFQKKLEEWTSKDYKENGFGLEWLGNIVGNSGIGTVDEKKETDLACRGHLCDMFLTDILTITMETAWGPMLTMWQLLFEKYLPEAEYIYTAEESGMGIYMTNNPDFQDMYIIDSWGSDIEYDECVSEEEVIRIFSEHLGLEPGLTIDEISSIVDDQEDFEANFHKWEFVPIVYVA